MPFKSDLVLAVPKPRGFALRMLIAIAIVAGATVIRLAAHPLLNDQVPFLVHLAAVVVATWFAGVGAGVLASLLGAEAVNFFFVPPRHELEFSRQDIAAMLAFVALGFALAWLVGRWARAESELQRLNRETAGRLQELQAILDTAPAAVFVAHDPQARYIYGNRFVGDFLGVPPDTNLSNTPPGGAPRFKIMHRGREMSADALPMQLAMARGQTVREVEFEVAGADGRVRTLFGSATPLYDEKGAVTGSVGVFMDITERKRLETQLRERMEELESIYDYAPIGLAVVDRDHRFLRINRRLAEINARSVEEHLGRRVSEVLPALAEFSTKVLSRVFAGEAVLDLAIAAEPPGETGRLHHFIQQWFPLRDAAGNVVSANVAVSDVTELVRVEEALRARGEELERWVQQLAESESRYRTMGETLPYGVWLSDARGRTLYTSQSFLDLLNMSREEMQQFGWTQRLVAEDVEPMLNKWFHCIETGEMWDHEHRIIDRHGEIRTVLTRGLPVRDEKGAVASWVGLNLDITDRKRMEVQLQEQATALDLANRLKDEFLATLSHELRTPLNAIVGWSDMLRRGALRGDAFQRAVEAIYRNAKLQNTMIEDVLDVSRIVSGKMALDMQAVDPGMVLGNTIESVRATADVKKITLVADVGPVGVTVTGDPTRLQQVFWNLLSNALKFTPAGGEVRVSLLRSSAHIRVDVADTGIGISPDFLPYVFERFRQSDSSITRRHGGLGLGLAIVRHLVELHGGTVAAASAGEGHGATFTVTLPLGRERLRREVVGSSAVFPAEPEVSRMPWLTGVRVLLAEDEEDAREMVASLLADRGALVAAAADASEALRRIGEFQPDVLLVDIAMPDVDGYTLLKRIRDAEGQNRHVAAIALTALARREDRERALASGFSQHLAKPVDAYALVNAVAEACEASRRRAE